MNAEEKNIAKNFRAGYVAIIGEPNVGKSTLLNSFIGQKISVVTKKPQTTRHKITGIFSTETYQIIFLDTPGILKPKYLLHDVMMSTTASAILEADLILVMIDAQNPEFENDIDAYIKKSTKPIYLIINKIDLVSKQSILPIIKTYSDRNIFKEIFPISALNNEGTNDLRDSIAKELPEHPPYYSLDAISELSERFFVSEIIREKIFETFKEEIPYSTTVDIVEFKEQSGRKDLINAEIYVERESQKGILIGKGGKALKEIGELSRKDIEKFLERPVYLELHVKVREKWKEQKIWLKRLGYTS